MKELPTAPNEAALNRRTLSAVLAVAAAVITLLVYLPTLGNSFVNWDDQVYVYRNEMIRVINVDFFKWVFTGVVSGNWHPLTIISHAVDYRFWGLDPWGHHLSSVLFHALNTLLVFVLAVRLLEACAGKDGRPTPGGKSLVAGFTAALLFGLHPLHVESVAWLSERKDLLCALFYILSTLAYLRYATGRGRVWYALSLITLALALMSKPMAVSLPLVLLIIDWYPLNRLMAGEGAAEVTVIRWKTLLEKVPFFIITLAASLAALWAQAAGGAVRSLESVPLSMRLLTSARGYILYLVKMFVPTGLAPYYPSPQEASLLSLEYFGAVALLGAVTALSLWCLRGRKWFSAAWFYYIITLLPVIGIVKIGAMAAADRYFYLPSIAPFILIGAGAGLLAGSRSRGAVVGSAAVGITIALLLSTLTVRQIGIWKDSLTLWTHEINLYPDSAVIAYANRGIAYGRLGKIDLALHDFNRAVEIKPDYDKAYYNRANALDILGRTDEAIDDLTRAVSANPGYAKAYYKRGTLYASQGRYEEAVRDLEKALEMNPGYRAAYAALARIYSLKGDTALSEHYMGMARGAGQRGGSYEE